MIMQRLKTHTHLKTQMQCICHVWTRDRSKIISWRRGQLSEDQLLRADHSSVDLCHFADGMETPTEIFQLWAKLWASNSGICILIIIFLKWIMISQVSQDCRLEDWSCRWWAEQGVRWLVRGGWAHSGEVMDGRALLQCFLTSPGC